MSYPILSNMSDKLSQYYVIKRDGRKENVHFDKITQRISKLLTGDMNKNIDVIEIVKKTITSIYPGISTKELDNQSAYQCAMMAPRHYDYALLAGRIHLSSLHKETMKTFVEKMELIQDSLGIYDTEWIEFIKKYRNKLNKAIDYNRDYSFDFFGIKTMERTYITRLDGQLVERPQDVFMRVASLIHCGDISKTIESYNLMSKKYFTHASPTLFNAGNKYGNLVSCFLLGTEDSISGISKTWNDVSHISKWGGGIGIHVSNIRAKGSNIRTTNGHSDGIIPMLQVYNSICRYINQSGRRKGSFAIYLEPHHADVFDFLELRKNTGAESERARDLFLALWVPDLFMKQVKANSDWYLFCPDKAPGLNDVYGEEYEKLYWKYVEENKYNEKIKARKLWEAIMTAQFETGSPYMAYKDNINSKSNQKNIGIIRSSNLCVAPETKILTKEGYQVISELKDKECEVWNGKEWSEVEVKQTGKNQELCKVIFDDFTELECTPYHKFYIQESYHKKKPVIKEAKDLKENDKIIKCDYPIIDNKKELKSAYTNGFFSGDGTYYNITSEEPRKCKFKSLEGKAYCKRHLSYQKGDETSDKCLGVSYTKKPHLTLYHEKIKLLEYLDYLSTGQVKDNKLNVTLKPIDIKEKFFVPHNYSIQSKLKWFEGYCDADGTITNNQGCQTLQISCIELDFLKEIKLMLNTCGINPKICLMSKKRKTLLPDGKGGQKLYDTKECYRLLINSGDLNKIIELGFNPKRLVINRNHLPNRDARKFIKIKKVEITNRIDDTYCFTEPKEHKGIFNGVITGQCCEIVEYSDSNETAACNLASIALSNFVVSKNIPEGGWVVYSKPNCPYCRWVKRMFINRNITFDEKVIQPEKPEELKNLKQKLGKENETITFPQVFHQDKLIGGMEETWGHFGKDYDYVKLWDVAYHVTKNLDKVIDKNYYPTTEARRSNMKHRPIGLGVQGLADTLAMLRIPYASDEALELNKKIFGTIYHASLSASSDISKEREEEMKIVIKYFEDHPKKKPSGEFYDNKFECYPKKIERLYHKLRPHSTELDKNKFLGSYTTFEGSPFSEGKLQYHLWNCEPVDINKLVEGKSWESLIEEIKAHGTRNSLLTALMPTASTSQLLGNYESFEAFTSNMYTRRTLAGEFIVVNKHLINDLTELGEWSETTRQQVMKDNGSIQNISLPNIVKQVYQTSYEMKQKYIIDGCAIRGSYVDQTQSMNLYFAQPDSRKLTSSQFYAWEKGLKTGLYYLRSKPSANATKITLVTNKTLGQSNEKIEEDDGCLMCSA